MLQVTNIKKFDSAEGTKEYELCDWCSTLYTGKYCPNC